MGKLLITGAHGFVGQHLVRECANAGWEVRTASRVGPLPLGTDHRIINEDFSVAAWQEVVAGCDNVIHAAARAHVLHETQPDPVMAYTRANVTLTERLAEAAIKAGVKRFVFISTIGVHGEKNSQPLTEASPLAPESNYAHSKLKAEDRLRALTAHGAMELCIVRSPLVYGPGVSANFLRMINVVAKGYPLPFASISNRRSFISIHNLALFLQLCLEHPGAAGQTFVASDGMDISTPELLKKIAQLLDKNLYLFAVSPRLLKWIAEVAGRGAVYQKLCGSLSVNQQKAIDHLGWQPRLTLDEALAETVSAYKKKREKP